MRKHSFGLFNSNPSFEQPSIGVNTLQNTLDTAVYNRTLTPEDAMAISRATRSANANKPYGLVSPGDIAREAVGAGISYLGGRAAGALVGSIGSFSPGEQKNLAQKGGLAALALHAAGRLLR